jgi:tetratricopeptide (TPR) repeat protein
MVAKQAYVCADPYVNVKVGPIALLTHGCFAVRESAGGGCGRGIVTRMKVSLCMIVRNEEAYLDGCLASVSGIADETIVVDTGSTDATRTIALSHGAQVYDFEWCDDFAAARNESIRRASGDWILWMDADDRLVQESGQTLRELLCSLGDEKVGYLMRVECPGPDGGPMHCAVHARLFPNHARVRWQYPVHEQIVPSLLAIGAELQTTDVRIRHVGYAPWRMPAKLQRNLAIVEKALVARPLDGYLLSIRGELLVGLGRAAEALVALSLCEGLCRGTLPAHVVALRCRAHAIDGALDDALVAAAHGLASHPLDSALWLLKAEVLAAMGDYFESECTLRTLLTLGASEAGFGVEDEMQAAVHARHRLSEVLAQQGRAAEAATEAHQVTLQRPAFGFAFLTLGEALLATGDHEGFEKLIEDLRGTPDRDVARAVLLAAQSRKNLRPDQALAFIDDAMRRHPEQLALQKARVQALFSAGIQGETLAEAIGLVTVADPFCVQTHSVRRASLRTSCRDGSVGTSQHSRT